MVTTDRYCWVVQRARQIAARSGHQRVELEDLCGALLESRGVAVQALVRLRARPKKLGQRLIERFQLAPRRAGAGFLHWLFRSNDLPGNRAAPPESDMVAQVLREATEEAKALNHDFVGTEHILLQLLQSAGPAADFLRESGLSYRETKAAIRSIYGQPESEQDVQCE